MSHRLCCHPLITAGKGKAPACWVCKEKQGETRSALPGAPLILLCPILCWEAPRQSHHMVWHVHEGFLELPSTWMNYQVSKEIAVNPVLVTAQTDQLVHFLVFGLLFLLQPNPRATELDSELSAQYKTEVCRSFNFYYFSGMITVQERQKYL